ncbi:hypothetical protein RJ55_08220 [Drechmeria coniospora]|nr:hypothetical protein RJ55_08220 [Drechmeria coniospora]
MKGTRVAAAAIGGSLLQSALAEPVPCCAVFVELQPIEFVCSGVTRQSTSTRTWTSCATGAPFSTVYSAWTGTEPSTLTVPPTGTYPGSVIIYTPSNMATAAESMNTILPPQPNQSNGQQPSEGGRSSPSQQQEVQALAQEASLSRRLLLSLRPRTRKVQATPRCHFDGLWWYNVEDDDHNHDFWYRVFHYIFWPVPIEYFLQFYFHGICPHRIPLALPPRALRASINYYNNLHRVVYEFYNHNIRRNHFYSYNIRGNDHIYYYYLWGNDYINHNV